MVIWKVVKRNTKRKKSINIKTVLLHVFGDLLGSIATIASGLAINFFTFDARYYFDPIASIIIVLLIFFGAIKLVKSCINTLMQSVPTDVDLSELRNEIRQLEGVIAIHDLHVWKLVESKVIGTVHILCLKKTEFMDIAVAIKDIFHSNGIHSTTIQPEFIKIKNLKETRRVCQLDCGKEECVEEQCCPNGKLEPGLDESELDELLNQTRKRKKSSKDTN